MIAGVGRRALQLGDVDQHAVRFFHAERFRLHLGNRLRRDRASGGREAGGPEVAHVGLAIDEDGPQHDLFRPADRAGELRIGARRLALGKEQVEGDDAGAKLVEPLGQRGERGTAPGPAPELRQACLVDRGNSYKPRRRARQCPQAHVIGLELDLANERHPNHVAVIREKECNNTQG